MTVAELLPLLHLDTGQGIVIRGPVVTEVTDQQLPQHISCMDVRAVQFGPVVINIWVRAGRELRAPQST